MIENDRHQLAQGDVIRFSELSEPSITVNWDKRVVRSEHPIEDLGTLEKLLLMFETNLLRSVKPEALIELASKAEVRVYPQGAIVCKDGGFGQ